jgi:hypothetical protein
MSPQKEISNPIKQITFSGGILVLVIVYVNKPGDSRVFWATLDLR